MTVKKKSLLEMWRGVSRRSFKATDSSKRVVVVIGVWQTGEFLAHYEGNSTLLYLNPTEEKWIFKLTIL